MALETRQTLTPGARQVLEVLVFLAVIGLGAIEGYRFIQPAQAAQVDLRGELQSIHEDLTKIKCRLNIDGMCPK